MKYIITQGEYSNKTILDVIEGDGDLNSLFNQFRELYMPGFGALVKQHKYPRHIPNWYEMLKNATKKIVEDGLQAEDTWCTFENGFLVWLERNHGFVALDEFHVVGINVDSEDKSG